MKTDHDLNRLLMSLGKQTYGRYKQIKGIYDFDKFGLAVDHVQVDPFEPPSKMRIIIDRKTAGIPQKRLGTPEEGAELVTFLLTSKAEYINGEVICINGGFTNVK